jgi:hypothetical protein
VQLSSVIPAKAGMTGDWEWQAVGFTASLFTVHCFTIHYPGRKKLANWVYSLIEKIGFQFELRIS